MLPADFILTRNAQALEQFACPVVPFERFREAVIQGVADESRLPALFAAPISGSDALRLTAVLAQSESGDIGLLSCDIGQSYSSLTPDCPAAQWFEREIAEQWHVQPIGHPWLKPIRFQPPRLSSWHGRPAHASQEHLAPASSSAAVSSSLMKQQKEKEEQEEETTTTGETPVILMGGTPMLRNNAAQIGITDFFKMEGAEVHEIAVGPVHAGVIEPGHFRFQCHGETVHHLEISLGYQHRGVERAMIAGPTARTIHYMETLAGDTTVSHATAYCQIIESLSKTRVPARAQAIRAVAAELERLANHIGDLGAMAGDVGFLPTMNYCGRIRGDALNLTAMLCGNRFGRGLITPGGVAYDVDETVIAKMIRRLDALHRDTTGAVELMFDTPSVLARFEGTGTLTEEFARSVGLVGVAARACGISRDIRQEFPYGIYRFTQIPVCTWPGGDCFARAYVRWLEVLQSITFVREQLHSLPGGATRYDAVPLQPNMLVAAMVEGWRGEICHVAQTDAQGRFASYKVVDPSFHNWFGLAYALREQQVSDFPLCNKSFNLSYCGHDL